MPPPILVSQAALAGTILASTIGTYSAISPPNPNPKSASPATEDSITRLKLTSKYAIRAAMVPIGLLALHTSSLACLYPNIPASILRHGAENGLNTSLITWSPATAVPLALVLCAGVPLRRGPYAALGKNFTFALAEPDRLTTTGLYRYVQHPSYTGLVTLILCNASLLGRVDGVLSCWIPPRLYPYLQTMELVLAPVGVLALMFAVWTRVRQEERMLRAKFGIEWEQWHARTWRFIPWIF
ncbi:hypothetical protein FHL15_001219 [Xylaria flabelliformis]|uniref:Protein-S-isoprenylcysteine O-methyltransferase n=1 Tax=Xylaria flabelliformis TaxID=2512241 RepID=A0A553ICU6_9PEZI|nr:hypothetical protein FHL15_001219 [Xylaria flabelliformis]